MLSDLVNAAGGTGAFLTILGVAIIGGVLETLIGLAITVRASTQS